MRLALDPPYCFGLFLFLFVCVSFAGSGEVAQRATSLGPKRSLFIWFVLFSFLFVFFFFEKSNPVSRPENRYVCLLVNVSLCFSLVFSLPLFTLPLSLSLYLSFLFYIFLILPCCHYFFLVCFLVFACLFGLFLCFSS